MALMLPGAALMIGAMAVVLERRRRRTVEVRKFTHTPNSSPAGQRKDAFASHWDGTRGQFCATRCVVRDALRSLSACTLRGPGQLRAARLWHRPGGNPIGQFGGSTPSN